MDLSIVIVNYKGCRVTADCLASIGRAQLRCSYEVIVIDNHSGDGSVEFLKEHFKAATVVEMPINGGFAYANNAGVQLAHGEYVALLNSDTLLRGSVLDQMLQYFKDHKEIGAMGCRCVNGDGLEIPAAHRLSSQRSLLCQVYIKPLLEWLGLQRRLVAGVVKTIYSKPTSVDWLTGSCILMPRKMYIAMNGMDEGYFLYMEDEDLCRRIHVRGFDVVLWPQIGYTHLCGASTQSSAFTLVEYMKSKYRYYSIYDEKKLPRYRRLIIRQLRQFGRVLPKCELEYAQSRFLQSIENASGASIGKV